MSKKHFEAIARRMNAAKPCGAEWTSAPEYKARLQQWTHDVVCIADTLATFNARFNRARFYRACDVEA